MSKKKILIISDHALSPSGVGLQTKYLAEGLLKTGDYTIIQLGAAIKHQNYNTVKVCEDFYIKPIDGFGNVNLLRSVLLNEQPDALIIFTDPRFFSWLFEIEDEIRQVCPILWWHVWDNYPYPDFNEWMYESTDVINCHSYLTYSMLKGKFSEKVNFIPHTFPKSVFFKLSKNIIKKEKIKILGKEREDNFVCIWVNRNCKRKRPADLLYGWKRFVKMIEGKKRKATLLLHTNPLDESGQNLFEICNNLNILDSVAFSTQKVSEREINILHNIADVCINVSFNEGFGLSTLSSMMTGTPIIASKTGGLTRQVVDHRDNTQNGIALEIDMQTVVGNQHVPYIFEDYVSHENVAKGLYKMYKIENKDLENLSKKVESYTKSEFDYIKMIEAWDKSLKQAIQKNKLTKIEVISL